MVAPDETNLTYLARATTNEENIIPICSKPAKLLCKTTLEKTDVPTLVVVVL
jgi:hypothetical protein